MKYWIEKRTGAHTYYVILREQNGIISGYGRRNWWLTSGNWTIYIRHYLTLRGARRKLKSLIPEREVIERIEVL